MTVFWKGYVAFWNENPQLLKSIINSKKKKKQKPQDSIFCVLYFKALFLWLFNIKVFEFFIFIYRSFLQHSTAAFSYLWYHKQSSCT